MAIANNYRNMETIDFFDGVLFGNLRPMNPK